MEGFDGINAKVLKELAEVIVDPITKLRISTVIWPDSLKCSEINSIFKEDDKSLPNNYRTISLISNVAKIFKKIIFNILFSFIQKHKVLSNNNLVLLKK